MVLIFFLDYSTFFSALRMFHSVIRSSGVEFKAKGILCWVWRKSTNIPKKAMTNIRMNNICGIFFWRELNAVKLFFVAYSRLLLINGDCQVIFCKVRGITRPMMQNRLRAAFYKIGGLPTTKAYMVFFSLIFFVCRMRNHAVWLNVCLCVHFSTILSVANVC